MICTHNIIKSSQGCGQKGLSIYVSIHGIAVTINSVFRETRHAKDGEWGIITSEPSNGIDRTVERRSDVDPGHVGVSGSVGSGTEEHSPINEEQKYIKAKQNKTKLTIYIYQYKYNTLSHLLTSQLTLHIFHNLTFISLLFSLLTRTVHFCQPQHSLSQYVCTVLPKQVYKIIVVYYEQFIYEKNKLILRIKNNYE